MSIHLVIGGAGIVGVALSRFLAAQGERVRIVDRMQPRASIPGAECCTVDIRDLAALRETFEETAVMYFAAVHVRFLATEAELRAVNIDGLAGALELALQQKVVKVVVISSSVVLGSDDGGRIGQHRGLYGQTRWEAEGVVGTFRHRGLDIALLRPHIVLGEGCPGVLAPAFRRILLGRPVWLPPGLDRAQPLVHIDELARACWLAGTRAASGAFDIGMSGERSLTDLLTCVIEEEGYAVKIHRFPRPLLAAAAKLERLLGRCVLGPGEAVFFEDGLCFDAAPLKVALAWEPALPDIDVVRRSFRDFRDRWRWESPHARVRRAGIFQ